LTLDVQGLEIPGNHRIGGTKIDSDGFVPADGHRPFGYLGSDSGEVHEKGERVASRK
jgi:hypothetical protein